MNATFGLARALRDRGHRVVYASIEDFRDTIECEGFEFYQLEKELVWAGRTRFAAKPIRNPIDWIRMERARRIWARTKHVEMMKGDAFIAEIGVIRPDLVLVDSPFVRFTPAIAQTDAPFVILESMVALDFSPTAPPLCSYHVPRNNVISSLCCRFSWMAYFLSKRVRQLLQFHSMVPERTMRLLCRRTGFDFAGLNFRRYFHPGVETVPEVLLSSPELDFPRMIKANRLYARVTTSRSRKEGSYDYRFDTVFARLKEARNQSDPRKLVYCSLGSMSFRYPGTAEFYRRVVAAFCGLPHVDLVMSVGNELSVSEFETGAPNINVFRRVPQLRLLEITNLMITHGGMNSIAECVYAGVPMLVYPGTNKIDQPGNAARVVYHRMGLMGKLRRDSAATIARKVERILTDTAYAERVERKGAEMIRNTTPEAIEATMERILSFAVTGRPRSACSLQPVIARP